jgi:hypothetical protein
MAHGPLCYRGPIAARPQGAVLPFPVPVLPRLQSATLVLYYTLWVSSDFYSSRSVQLRLILNKPPILVANLLLTGLLSCSDHVHLLLTSRLSHTIIMRLHSYFFTLCFVVSLGTAANISLIEIVTELPSCAVSFDF